MAKNVVFKPFDRNGGLDLFDESFVCASEEDFGNDISSVEELDMNELEILRDDILEGISDYQMIVDIELDSNHKDVETIKITNQRIGQLKAELHAVKKQIRSLRKIEREAIAV